MATRRLSAVFETQRKQIDVKRKKERQRHLKDALIPLPSTRERTLTIPLIKESQSEVAGTRKQQQQRTDDQSQSLFFSMLPPEIRTKIYIEVLGGEVIRIFKDETSRYVKWLPQRRSLLDFPMTCRRIYSETIDLLYSHNTFFFNDLDTVLWFASTILPHRLAVIRNLHVQWDCVCFWHPRMRPPPPYDKDTWMEVWRIIQSMAGLRELMVRIWNGPKMNAETEIEVFKPLTEVRGLERFELELPWRYQGEGEEGHQDAPFQVKRVRREYDMTGF